MIQMDRFAGVPWQSSLRALARPIASAVSLAVVVGAIRAETGPLGPGGLLAITVLGVLLVGLLNVDVFKRVYREQRHQSPTPAPA